MPSPRALPVPPEAIVVLNDALVERALEVSGVAEIARSQFNLAVRNYNEAIVQFPALLVAWAVRLRPAAPLR